MNYVLIPVIYFCLTKFDLRELPESHSLSKQQILDMFPTKAINFIFTHNIRIMNFTNNFEYSYNWYTHFQRVVLFTFTLEFLALECIRVPHA